MCDTPLSHRFATQDRNALLLYNGRFNEKHDFIALEIVEEQLQLTFSAGAASCGYRSISQALYRLSLSLSS